MGAVVETFERGRDRGKARGKGESRAAAFEIGEVSRRFLLGFGRSHTGARLRRLKTPLGFGQVRS